jgi:hypothetical protein
MLFDVVMLKDCIACCFGNTVNVSVYANYSVMWIISSFQVSFHCTFVIFDEIDNNINNRTCCGHKGKAEKASVFSVMTAHRIQLK